MFLAILILSTCLFAFLAFCVLTRLGAGWGVRTYEISPHGTVTPPGSREHLPRTPECTCYYDPNGGPYGRPHWVNGRHCERYHITHGEWPSWCQGPAH